MLNRVHRVEMIYVCDVGDLTRNQLAVALRSISMHSQRKFLRKTLKCVYYKGKKFLTLRTFVTLAKFGQDRDISWFAAWRSG